MAVPLWNSFHVKGDVTYWEIEYFLYELSAKTGFKPFDWSSSVASPQLIQ